MLSFLPAPVLGIISSVLLLLNLVFWMLPLFVVAVAKLLVPIPAWRSICMHALVWLASTWIDFNSLIARLHDIDWQITGRETLRRDRWYLVVSNHQSWVDIFVLQRALNNHIPFLKFFIKRQLIWVPLLGFAWWALEMPFMRRHSREAIARNPALRRQDLEATRKLCEGIRHTPSTVMNFAEGTRFTAEKKRRSKSPYDFLLRPKTGGLGLVMATLGETLTSMLDVTIVYPGPEVTFWQLLTGRIERIVVHIEEREIPAELRDVDDPGAAEYRKKLRNWIDAIWEQKEQRMKAIAARAD